MNKLSFETFQIANRTRSKRFFEPASVDSWSPADTVVGMIGELGEACNVMKKLKRAQLGMVNKNKEGRQVDALTPEVRHKLMEEFAGAMLYFDQLAEAFGIDWQDAIEYTYNEKSKELGFPERIYDGKFVVVTRSNDIAEEFDIVHPSTAQEVWESKYSRPHSEQPFNERRLQVGDEIPEEPAPDFANMAFSVDIEFSQHLDLNHGDRLKVHIKDGKAVGCEVKERRPAAMIITERDERRVYPGVEQAREDEIAIIYAPKDRGSEIDPPDDYSRLMTITVEDNPLISVKKVARGIQKGLKKKFKEYRFKTEAIM